MKKTIGLSFYFVLLLNTNGYAEVVTDGSMGAVQQLSGRMTIPQSLGTTAGNNLFHSFQTFNVNTGESATFTGDAALKNVISRVTGGQVSTIDGTLRSIIPNANFYFINPAGVTFGANASIDVPAAFHVSTAQKINFGSEFFDTSIGASAPPSSSLSVSEPSSFGFLGNQLGDISIQQSWINFKQGSSVSLSARNISMVGKSLFETAKLVVPGGDLQLSAVGRTTAEIALDHLAKPALSGQLNITNNSYLNVSDNGAGYIELNGGNITLDNQGHIEAYNMGDKDATTEKGIYITANNLDVTNYSAIRTSNVAKGKGADINFKITGKLNINKGIQIDSFTENAGNAGNLTINAKEIEIKSGVISSDSFGDGNAGSLLIKGEKLSVLKGDYSGYISSNAYGKLGNAGVVNIEEEEILIDGGKISNASQPETHGYWVGKGNANTLMVTAKNITLLNSGEISSSSTTHGNAGSVIVTAPVISMDNSTITVDARSEGNAGSLTINSHNLNILNGSGISSDTYGKGNAGNVTVNNSDTLTIDRKGNSKFTGISSDANVNSTGSSGKVDVKSGVLQIFNGGQIASDTWAEGNAGTVNVKADSIKIDGEKSISITGISSDAVSGSTGAANSVIVDVNVLDMTNGGKISSDTESSGDADLVQVHANVITLSNHASISSSTSGSGAAGNVIVESPNITLNSSAEISALAKVNSGGQTGTITLLNPQKVTLNSHGKISIQNDSSISTPETITPHNLTLSIPSLTMNGGEITAATSGTVKAGNVTVNVSKDRLVMNNKATINSGTTGNGGAGNVTVSAPDILMDESEIAARTTSTGNAGIVVVNANNSLTTKNASAISSSSNSSGSSGNIEVSAPVIVLDNSHISARAKEKSSGHTGNVTVNASKSLQLVNNGAILIENLAPITDPLVVANIKPGIITISAPDIDLKDSKISSESQGAVDAGDILINFSHALTMDPSFITTSANLGNGGSITINGGELISLQNSGFLTSVLGANGNGGDINVIAKALIMNTGVIQANAVGGSGGNINLNLKSLIPSQNLLIKGGAKVVWQPYVQGFNVIQAASESGVSGSINVTSPQFDISGSLSELTSVALTPALENNPCLSATAYSSTLARRGKGGIPTDETKSTFIPAIAGNTNNSLKVSLDVSEQKQLFSNSLIEKEKYSCMAI